MNPHKLVKMVNEIAAYFEAEPDRAVVLQGIGSHLKRFWDPRMRRELVHWVDDHNGEGLRPTALEAIQAHRHELAPPAPDAQAS